MVCCVKRITDVLSTIRLFGPLLANNCKSGTLILPYFLLQDIRCTWQSEKNNCQLNFFRNKASWGSSIVDIIANWLQGPMQPMKQYFSVRTYFYFDCVDLKKLNKAISKSKPCEHTVSYTARVQNIHLLKLSKYEPFWRLLLALILIARIFN